MITGLSSQSFRGTQSTDNDHRPTATVWDYKRCGVNVYMKNKSGSLIRTHGKTLIFFYGYTCVCGYYGYGRGWGAEKRARKEGLILFALTSRMIGLSCDKVSKNRHYFYYENNGQICKFLIANC